MRTMSTTGAARPARVISTPKCLISRLRHDERGVLDIELIGFVPILVLVTMFAHQALPDWVRLESVSDSCGPGHCVQVTARVPIGIPSITSEHVTVTRTAYFPED